MRELRQIPEPTIPHAQAWDILNHLREVVLVCDHQGRIKFVNAAWTSLSGFSVDETVGRTLVDFTHEGDREASQQNFARLMRGDPARVTRMVRRGLTKWGEIKYLDISVQHASRAEGLICTLVDVTEAIRERERTREVELDLKSFFDSSPFPIGLVEFRDGAIERLIRNPAADRLVKDSHFGDELMAFWMSKYREARHVGRAVHFEYDQPSERGTLHLRCTVNYVATSEDGLERYSYVIADRTVENARERVIEAQRTQMVHSARLSALGEMAAGVAHEINNPLAIISGTSQLLRLKVESDRANPEFVTEACERITSTVGRIAKIINGLRAMGRDGSGDPLESASLNVIIDDALELCQTRIRNHQVVLTAVKPAHEVSIPCQSVQIAQVLVNLLNNAFDAVVAHARKEISITLVDGADQVRIEVTDSGPGIPAEVRERIMSPFFTTKPVGQGTGLGLSLSRGIVELHKGTLSFVTGGAGTTFTVTLPRRHP